MRASTFFIATHKEIPAEAELISHQLMLKAGLIKKVASGIYTWMPLGLRVLRKIEHIVREEMNRAGAIEILMPSAQPASLWKASGRWSLYGPELLRFYDRHQREFCLGPTHEEVITDLAKQEIHHRRQLPLTFYQIQTKFRDEVRPRFGLMRAREFIMKDAYSFHEDKTCLQKTYEVLYQAYERIFTRIAFNFRAVRADTGAIGGTVSHEFQVLADSGEDVIAYCPESDYAANIELAAIKIPAIKPQQPTDEIKKIHTPHIKTIKDLSHFLNCDPSTVAKAIVVDGKNNEPVLLLVQGNHELNTVKASKLEAVKTPLTFSSEKTIQAIFGASPGFIGPVGFSGTIYADYSLANQRTVIAGANQNDFHLSGIHWGRDCKEIVWADLRNAQEGDESPCGKGFLKLGRGIEVGHLFQLGNKYSAQMQSVFLDQNNASQPFEMGCYGIGISRILPAFIEQFHDAKGIIFNDALSPFDLVITPLGYHEHSKVRNVADQLYQTFLSQGLNPLLDDRHERAGILLADSELIGIAHRIVIGERNLKENKVEYQKRQQPVSQTLLIDEVIHLLTTHFSVLKKTSND